MNTFGKILAFCIFVIALAVVALLGLDFSIRQAWKKGYDDLKDELVVLTAKVKNNDKTNADLNMQVKKSEEDKKTGDAKFMERLEEKDSIIKKKENDIAEERIKAEEHKLTAQSAIAETDRLKEEVTGLLATLKKRDFVIVELEKDIKNARSAEIAAKNDATTYQIRNQNLLAEIRRLTTELALLQNKGAGGTLSNIIRDPNAPNPPAVAVKGRVDEINGMDKSLVKLSVGSDHGVNKNHTLEVYRTEPRAEYLGTIRIMDSQPHFSIGKILRSSLPHSPLQTGDIVVGSIGP